MLVLVVYRAQPIGEHALEVNYYALAVLTTSTVTYDASPGAFSDSASVKYEQVSHEYYIPYPEDPSPPDSSMEFEGWYWDATFTTRLTPNSIMKHIPVTLYARYVPVTNNRTVNFYDETTKGIELIHTATVPMGESIKDSSGASYPAGYAKGTSKPGMGLFLGWYYSSTNGVKVEFLDSTPVDNNIDLYASWQPVTYTITFDYNGPYDVRYVLSGATNSLATHGQPPQGQKLTQDDRLLPITPEPMDAGYVFAGWFTGVNGTGTQFTAATRILEDMVVYPHFVEAGDVLIQYVSFDESMGNVARSSEYVAPVSGTPFGSAAIAEPGHLFDRWELDGATVATTESFVPTRAPGELWTARTYIAHFKAYPDVTLTYRTDGNTDEMGTVRDIDSGNQVVETHEDINPEIGVPQMTAASANDGYRFSGWYVDDNFISGNEELELADLLKDVDGRYISAIYVAVFAEEDKVLIEYQSSDITMGTVSLAEEYLNPAIGTPDGSTATPIKGNLFDHWELDGATVATTESFVPTRAPGELWTARTYIAHFKAYPDVTLTYRTDGNTDEMGTVRDIDSGNQVVETHEDINPEIGVPQMTAASANDGYRFSGWYVDDNFISGNEELELADLLKDVDGRYISATYVAFFAEEDKVLIEYQSSDITMGTVSLAEEYLNPAIGTPDGSTATPIKGNLFDHWELDGATVATTESLVPTRAPGELWTARTYIAHFKAYPDVTLTYRTDGNTDEMGTVRDIDSGNQVVETHEDINPEIGVPLMTAASANDGYRFSGWYVDDNFISGNEELELADLLKDVDGRYMSATYVAVFAQDPVDVEDDILIKYQSADTTMGTVSLDEELLDPIDGVAAGSTAVPKAGYRFVKWVDLSGNEVGTSNFLLPEKTTGRYQEETYTAIFEEEQVLHTFLVGNAAGGSVSPTQQNLGVISGVATGSTPTASTGYRFIRWTESADGTGASIPEGAQNRIIPQKQNGLHVNRTYYAHFERVDTPVTEVTPTTGPVVTPTPRPTTIREDNDPDYRRPTVAIGGVLYDIADADVPLGGFGSRNMGDCAY